MLNLLNRLVVILVFLFLLVVTALFIVVPVPIINLVLDNLTNLKTAIESTAQGRILTVLVGLGLGLVWFLILLLEVWRSAPRAVRVQKVSGGEIELTLDSIAQRLEYRMDQLPDVVKVRPRVSAGRGGVDLYLEVETGADIDIPLKTEEILVVAREVVEERMGVKLNKVKVSLRQGPRPVG
ncbi:MAG: hypothetical protein HYX86_03100 [Chloroflexi bacterium]|nr:hypothetical protein [Chloroflexota bacterium]